MIFFGIIQLAPQDIFLEIMKNVEEKLTLFANIVSKLFTYTKANNSALTW